MKTTVVVNPHSGKLRRAAVWRELERRLRSALPSAEIRLTEKPGDAEIFTRRAINEGAQRMVAVGGDGTLGEVANGFFDHGIAINPATIFSFVMTGTGNDFQKTLGRQTDLLASVEALIEPRQKTIDLGRLVYQGHDGAEQSRYFLNIASFGMSGSVDRRVNRMRLKGLLGGKISFLLATAGALASYRNQAVHYRVDDGEPVEAVIRLVIVANGKYSGGGMMTAPLAELDDGLLDIVTFENISSGEIVRHLGALYKGEHLGRDKVRHFRARQIDVWSREEVLLDVDGEAPGRLPARFEIVPRALRLGY